MDFKSEPAWATHGDLKDQLLTGLLAQAPAACLRNPSPTSGLWVAAGASTPGLPHRQMLPEQKEPGKTSQPPPQQSASTHRGVTLVASPSVCHDALCSATSLATQQHTLATLSACTDMPGQAGGCRLWPPLTRPHQI